MSNTLSLEAQLFGYAQTERVLAMSSTANKEKAKELWSTLKPITDQHEFEIGSKFQAHGFQDIYRKRFGYSRSTGDLMELKAMGNSVVITLKSGQYGRELNHCFFKLPVSYLGGNPEKQLRLDEAYFVTVFKRVTRFRAYRKVVAERAKVAAQIQEELRLEAEKALPVELVPVPKKVLMQVIAALHFYAQEENTLTIRGDAEKLARFHKDSAWRYMGEEDRGYERFLENGTAASNAEDLLSALLSDYEDALHPI